jgi:Na+-transporting methylmalonyl-CoA/oxaloacetate decarboxylase gamma subunit
MGINVQAFLESLVIMAKGMAGVFGVILIILLCTLLLQRVFRNKD